MAEFIGLFGRVADVKAVKSLGVCRVVIEVPIEQHRQVTNGFWDADVLVTLLLAVVFGLGVTWGAWSEFQAEKNNWQEMDK